ncbi:MAG: dihydrofolate reductase [Lachnospiraceae bacterium]|jgi:lactate dehydrogenase-like 2-hydroxyacid dehydrogenase|nr:dihydrofolate reductase [Lachnospiraceae bacterium]
MNDKFNKIVVLEKIVITSDGLKELQNYCEELVIYNDTAEGEEENVKRIGDADCILVSYSAKITRKIIDRAPNLKYIGLGASLYHEKYSNVDLQACRDNNIVVLPLKDYGDEGTIEYIVAELLNILHGLKQNRWKEKVHELNTLKVGIIGLGTIGGMTARALKCFGADVYYYSRHRKPEFEKENIKYLPLNELLETVSVVSISVNRDSLVMNKEAFKIFENGKIIINTSLGICYDIEALDEWIKDKSNYYICDNASMSEETKHIVENSNVIYNDLHAGHSMQTDIRATEQTISNIRNFLKVDSNHFERIKNV